MGDTPKPPGGNMGDTPKPNVGQTGVILGTYR